MIRSKIVLARVALALLTIGELISLYQVLFDAWMTAYAPADASQWRARLYIRLVTAVVIALFWGFLAVWLYWQRRQPGSTR